MRDWVPISWWSNEGPPDEWVRQVRDAVENGYTTIKLKQRPWHDIREQMTAIDASVPRHFRVDLDANGSMHNAAAAMPVMRGLERFDIVAMFETPIPQPDILGNRQLRQVISRPIAMHFGSPPFTTAIREGVCDGFVVGGGASRVMYQGILSAEANMPFWLQMVGNGLTTTWAAHLGAVLTHATWPAITCINLYRHHLLKRPIEVVGGFHRVPDGPGLGVEVDEEAMHGFLVPDDVMGPFRDRDEPYNFPRPRFIRTAVYPDGRRVHFSNIRPRLAVGGLHARRAHGILAGRRHRWLRRPVAPYEGTARIRGVTPHQPGGDLNQPGGDLDRPKCDLNWLN